MISIIAHLPDIYQYFPGQMSGNPYSNVYMFLGKQIGMESLVIDWAKEEAKMAKIVLNIHVYC